MLGRVQAQKSFGDEALELHVSDRHFLMKASRPIDWAASINTTNEPGPDPLAEETMDNEEPGPAFIAD